MYATVDTVTDRIPMGNGGARRNGASLEGGPTVSSRGVSLRTSSPSTARSRAQRSEVTLDACAVGETRCPYCDKRVRGDRKG